MEPSRARPRRGTATAEFFTSGYGLPVPANGMIIRTGKKATSKAAVIREMITAAYAHANGLGPVIYAQFYYGTQGEMKTLMRAPREAGAWDAAVPLFPPLGDLGGQVGEKKAAFTCAVAEAWQGDCERKSAATPTMRATSSHQLPLHRSLSVSACAPPTRASGTWTSSAPTCCGAATTVAGLCFTDFDGYFCRILSPGLRADTRHCRIAATAACVLGEIRRKEDKATWAKYAPEVRRAMAEIAGVDLDNIEVQDWCFFLKNVGETRTVVKDGKQTRLTEESLTNEERVLGGRFRNHLFNYFMDPEDEALLTAASSL